MLQCGGIGFQHLIDVQCVVGYVGIEIRYRLVAHFGNGVHEHRFVIINLAVVHLAFEHLLGHAGLFALQFLYALANLGARLSCDYNVQPVLLGRLVLAGQDFHLVAALQFLSDGHVLVADFGSDALVAHLGVDAVGKIQNGGSHGQFEQVAFGREHKHFVFNQILLELVHQLHVVAGFQHAAHVGQPFVHTALSAPDAFVSPVGGKSVFGNIVHSFRANLHLHPFLFGPQYSNVQTLVTVALGYAQPVAHSFGVALVHVGDDAEGLPAVHLFFFRFAVQNDAYGKKVIYAIHAYMLLFHLLPDAVDAFCASFHVELQSGFAQLFLNGVNEVGNVGVATSFRFVQLFLDMVVGIVFQIFETQVLQFAFQLVQTQFVSQRSIKICRFHGHLALCFHLWRVFDLAHGVHSVCQHDENHAHVFSKRNQQAAEIFALHSGTLLVKVANAQKAFDDVCHIFAKIFLHLLYGYRTTLDGGADHDTDNGTARKANFLHYKHGRFQIVQ